MATLVGRFQALPQAQVIRRQLRAQQGDVLEQLGEPVHRRDEVLVRLALVGVDDGLDAGLGFLEVLALGAGLLGLLDGGVGGVGQGVDRGRILLEERRRLRSWPASYSSALTPAFWRKSLYQVTASLAALLALVSLSFSDSSWASERE